MKTQKKTLPHWGTSGPESLETSAPAPGAAFRLGYSCPMSRVWRNWPGAAGLAEDMQVSIYKLAAEPLGLLRFLQQPHALGL